MKLTSIVAKSGSWRERRGIERADIGRFQRDYALVLAQPRMKLAASDIDRVDACRAAREQHLGEAAGRGADIETDAPGQLEAEMIERGRELHPAARHPRMLGARLQLRASAISSDAFFSRTPSAVTRPAAIAACARVRLSKRPRSTSSTSARLRLVMKLT